jgi:hypothetical protein
MSKDEEFTKNLSCHIDDNEESLELIAIKRDKDRDMQERALSIVKEFISERKLILYGGIAIDYSLRLKGSSIYSDDELPDYDFLSPRSVDDAYDLAELLQSKGHHNVSAIRATHVQTMRVRVDFIVVADISYIPESVFKTLEYLEYKDLRILHPNFQRIDMHLSLSFPFLAPPNVAIFNRWRKDIKRFNMFEKYYPLEDNDSKKKIGSIYSNEQYIIPENLLSVIAFHGFAGYALIYRSLQYTFQEFKVEPTALFKSLPTINIKLEKNGNGAVSISLQSPSLELVTSDPKTVQSGLGESKIQHYKSYMEYIPEHFIARDKNMVVYSAESQLLSMSITTIDGIRIQIPSIQYLLSYFLAKALIDKENNIYRSFYIGLLNIIKIAEELFEGKPGLENIINACPFFLPLQFLGKDNKHPSYQIQQMDTKMKLGTASGEEINIMSKLPKKGYYPDQAKKRPEFDYKSKLFVRDGSEETSE